MPSGKKSKQARRVAANPPPVQSKGGPRRRQANPRVLALGGGVALLAIVGIVLGIVLSGGGTKKTDFPATGSVAAGLPGASDVVAQYKGIPQAGMALGSPTAPVTLVEYIDLQCPFCQQFETQVMPHILTTYVRTNKVRVELRPLAFIGPDSVSGRKALIAAAEQNRAFNFAEILYYNQGTENAGWLSTTMIGQAAASIPGLDVYRLLDGRSAGAISGQAKTFDEQGLADKVSGTPTLYVGKTGTKGKQVQLASPTDEQAVVDAIEAALP